MKKILLLGSTGSIGQSTLQVIREFKDEYHLIGIAAHSNVESLLQQAKEFQPKSIALFDQTKASLLKTQISHTKFFSGPEGLLEMIAEEKVDLCILAMSGSEGIRPALLALEMGADLALANKEILVAAGEIITTKARELGRQILPLDSEHSAIFQCMQGYQKEDVDKIILTASGGPFFRREKDFDKITLEEALLHPTWKMGKKITVDSSTLMNKGLEVIEAHWLFSLPPSKIEVLVHPQSIIHSLVTFIDGSTLAQLSHNSMVLPIQCALSYPKKMKRIIPELDLKKVSPLEFYDVDHKKFPALRLAYQALDEGGATPCFLNAANEVLVERFLKGEIRWIQISYFLQTLLENSPKISKITLDDLDEVAKIARDKAYLIK